MNEIEGLIQAYEQYVRLPWDPNLAGQQKVWFAIYDPANERRLRLRIQEFENATVRANHSWRLMDITDTFAQWMAVHDYREEYFMRPEDMELALKNYEEYLAEFVNKELSAETVTEKTVVAISGVGSLFGLTYASTLLKEVAQSIRGRLLVFFPGHHEGTVYRLLDARDGWDYLAVAITAGEGKAG